MKSVSQKMLLKLNNDLPVFGLQAIIKIQMRNVRADQNQITSHIAGYVLTYMTYSVTGLNIYQFVFRVIMPEKIIFQTWFKQSERLTRVWQNDLSLYFHLIYFSNKVQYRNKNSFFCQYRANKGHYRCWIPGPLRVALLYY